MKRCVIRSAAAIALAVYAAEPAAIRVNTPDGMTTTVTLRQEYDSATRTLTLRLKGAALPANLSVTF